MPYLEALQRKFFSIACLRCVYSSLSLGYIHGTSQAIPKLGLSDVEIIVKDLLLPLNAYKPHSPHGRTLLQVLLDKVASYLRAGTRSGDVTLLHSAQSYLDLVDFVVVEKKAAPAIQLLRFYCSSVSTKMTLQKFSKEDRPLITCSIAETLEAANEDPQPQDDGVPLDHLKRQLVDSCPFLFEVRDNCLIYRLT